MNLVLLRHGQSLWNLENKFTGWTDVPLTEKGILEAKEAGRKLKENGFNFDIAYTSVLVRAIDTLKYALQEMNIDIPIKYSYKLNERHYGALQGLNKDETREKYGEEQVKLWRRSADVRPPKLTKEDSRYPGNDPKYKNLKEEELPLCENLLDTMKRTTSYFDEEIKSKLNDGKNVLIVAHGNSLRGLVKYLENLSNEEIVNFEIPTGVPYIYELDENLKITDKYFL